MKRALFLCLLLASVAAAHAAAPPPQWLPQESWPGGRQYDARLERTVRFWGTGVPAADLFASVTKQTGVALSFDPPDDDNARICLNVYLNPKEPPTLRDVLVQIGWVMDCAWAVEGEGEQSRYVLLHTNLGEGARERLQRGQTAEYAAEREAMQQAAARDRAASMAKLRELAGVLDLDRASAIARYRGRDDVSLLVLLDEGRRATARFLLTIMDQLDTLARAPRPGQLQLEWDQLTPTQRGYLQQAMQPTVDEVARTSAGPPGSLPTDWPALERRKLRVTVAFYSFLGVGCTLSYPLAPSEVEPAPTTEGDRSPLPEGEAASEPEREVGQQVLYLAADTQFGDWGPSIVGLEVRRLLEDPASGQEWEALRRQDEEQRREAISRRHAARELAASATLSPEAAALLSTVRLTLLPDRLYAAWQVQEAVAAASGLHVVSDCLLQGPEPLRRWMDLLSLDGSAEPSALAALRATATSRQPPLVYPVFGMALDWGVDGWEWGDAGRFLRFRSHNRDLWRSAFLPAHTVGTLDARVDARLPDDLDATEPRPEVEVPRDLCADAALLGGLTEAQRRWGGLLAYGDPSDLRERYQQAFREGTFIATADLPLATELFSRIGAEQFAEMAREGLVAGVDIALPDSVGLARGGTLRFGPGEVAPLPAPSWRSCDYAAANWWSLRLENQGGGSTTFSSIPGSLLLCPQRLPHLVPPPPEYAP